MKNKFIEMTDNITKIYSLLERIDSGFREFNLLTEELILEAASLADVHEKYYNQIPEEEFREIVAADPTSGEDKMGKYSKWLLALYTGGNLKLEDLYKATEYLTTFHKYKNKLERKDIGQYKSLQDLFQSIEPYADNTQAASHKEELRKIKEGAEKVYEDDEWLVIIPKTQEAAIEYGKGTQWCTAATGSRNYFDDYNRQGPLYININKKNGEKYQFHFETNSFMDASDSPIESAYEIGLSDGLLEFYKENKPKGYLSLLGGGEPDEILYQVEQMIDSGQSPEDVFLDIYEPCNGNSNYHIGVISKRSNYYDDDDVCAVLLDNENNIVSSYFQYQGETEGFIKACDYYGEDYFYINAMTGDYLWCDNENREGFDYADDFYDGVAEVKKDHMHNILKEDGTFVSKIWFDNIQRMYDIEGYDDGSLFIVTSNNKQNIMDINGNILLKEWLDKIEYKGCGGYIKVYNQEGKINYIDHYNNGKFFLLFNDWFEKPAIPQDGYCIVYENNKANLYDIDSQKFVFQNFGFDEILYMGFDSNNTGLMYVRIGDKCNIANLRNGKPTSVFRQWVDKLLSSFKDNEIIAVSVNGKCNFADINGNYLSDVWYDRIQSPYFMNDFWVVDLNEKCNFLDKSLKPCFNEWLPLISHTDSFDSERLQKLANNKGLLIASFYGDENNYSNKYVLDLSNGTVDRYDDYIEKHNIDMNYYG